MKNEQKIRVAVNGYGVIGKRVADVVTDWRAEVVRSKEYALFGATP